MSGRAARAVKRTGTFLKGDDGSIMWLARMTVVTVVQVVSAINEYMRLRRDEEVSVDE